MDRQDVYEDVKSIISDISGYERDRITEQLRVADDIGIAGDDGDDLFQALDDRFEVDWKGVDMGAMFGPEAGLSLPFMPWPHADDRVQDCTVGDLVNSIIAGRWVGSPPRRLSPEEKSWLRKREWLQLAGFWGAIALFSFVIN